VFYITYVNNEKNQCYIQKKYLFESCMNWIGGFVNMIFDRICFCSPK